MKNRLLAFIALAMIMAAVLGALQVAADSKPAIIVDSFSLKEGGAYAGRDFTLIVNLANTQPTRCAYALTTSVSSGFPFIMRGTSTFYSGQLCAPDAKAVDIPMRVDPTASGGFYQVELTNSYETATGVQFSSSSTLNLYVNGTPDISAYVINSDPVDVYPGDTGILTVNIQNNGNFQAESVNALLRAPEPLEVKWSKSFNAISLLAPKESKAVDFAVEVPKNGEAKTYSLSLVITYLDENKQPQQKIVEIPFGVKKKAQFEAQSSLGAFYSNQNGRHAEVILKNTGTDAALKVRARIIPMFPFSTDGSVRYVDALEPGSSAPVDFRVDVNKDAKPGQYVVDVLVDFEDTQGKKFQDTAQAAFVVNPKGLFRAVFMDYWVLWLIAAAVAFAIRRRRMKGLSGKRA